MDSMRGNLLADASTKTKWLNISRCIFGLFFAGQLCKMRASSLIPILLLILSGPASALSKTDSNNSWSDFDRLVVSAQNLMLTHPQTALFEAKTAAKIADRHYTEDRYPQSKGRALWLEAEALTRTGRLAEARAVADQGSNLAAKDRKSTKLVGDLALSQGRIAEATGDVARAMKDYQQAHAVFAKLGIVRSQALALLALGDLYEKARDFDREIRYYHEAARTYAADPEITVAVFNNLGFAYLQMGKYQNAIERFQYALKVANSLKSNVLQATILSDLAFSYAKLEKLDDAERAANRSLLLLSKKDEIGQAHFAWGAKAEIAYRRGDMIAAASYLKKVFDGINLQTTTPRFRDLHKVAYTVYRATGNLPLAIAHLEAFKRLDDEGRSLAASANQALLGARFDFDRQGFEIARLRAAELERDVKLRKSQAETELIVFVSIILVALLLLIWIAWRNAMLKRHRNDIERKNIALVKTLAERNTEIARRTEVESQLRIAAESAQQASRAKSHFLANMSHELRTPLNAIIGFSQLMLGGYGKSNKTEEYAGNILEGGRHLLAVLNNILDMARIESGKMELEEQVVRLDDVAGDALSVLGCRETYPRKVFRLAGDSDIHVLGDAVRLRQTFINLIYNAIKFTGEDGRIDIQIEKKRNGVDITVQDDGQGIPEDKLSLIMEPFGQAENTYARAHGGAGLGLPIVKSLVELHGGTFTIKSEIGRGTCARIHLPKERIVRTETILDPHHPMLVDIESAA